MVASVPAMNHDDEMGAGKGRQPRRPHFLKEWMAWRDKRNIDLIDDLGVDKSYISRWLKGTTPGEAWAEKLRVYFKAGPDGIFERPSSVWFTEFLEERDDLDFERVKNTLEAAFPHQDGKAKH